MNELIIENEEIWKDIPGFSKYQVSNKGKVRSLDSIGWNNNKLKGRILKPTSNKGYLRVSLYKDGIPNNWVYVSRIVAEAFIPNPLNLPEVNHKNLNKQDNSKENLEWSTRKGNMDHAKQNGAILSGENHKKSKLTWDLVKKIRKEYFEDKYATNSILGKKYKICKENINSIISNKYWVDSEYQKFIGSQEHQEKFRLVRKMSGERHPMTKLTREDVLSIREIRGKSLEVIASEFNISQRHVKAILQRKTWIHI